MGTWTVITHCIFFLMSVTIGAKVWTSLFDLYPRRIFHKIASFLPWGRGKAPTKSEVDWSNSFFGNCANKHFQTVKVFNSNKEKPQGKAESPPADKFSKVISRLMLPVNISVVS